MIKDGKEASHDRLNSNTYKNAKEKAIASCAVRFLTIFVRL
ncbi:hypothetical protein [Microseira wollei]|nr:hypothetical protein [Microseira wollei]